MQSYRYEVVIVGAGIAGTSAAWFLSRTGLKVCIIDWRSWENLGDKPCADAISKHHIEHLGIPEPKGDEIEGIINGATIFSPREDAYLKVPGEGYEINTSLYVKNLLANALEKGHVEFFGRTKAIAPIIKDGFVKGIIAKRNGNRIELLSNVVIDASGMARVVARNLPKQWPVAEPINAEDLNIAYREERIPSSEITDSTWIRIYLNNTIAPGGYWWLFPKNRIGVVNIGLGVQGGKNYPNPKDLFYKYIVNRYEIRYSKVIKAGGAPVPTRRPIASLVWNGIAVIGDAAYTANPIHGGGKGPAMKSAKCIAEAIIEASTRGHYSAMDLWMANKCYADIYGAKQAALDIFRIFLQSLSDDDLEYVLKKGIVKSSDILEASLTGILSLSFVDKVIRFALALGKPSLLLKLKLVKEFMDRVRRLYAKYPRDVQSFSRWLNELKTTYSEFKSKIT
ncbi:MAG: geranylgeranyl hydrogenase [Thermoprotei archaeon]|nr:MAG: geranylgeranyl hydrogenase [Thermoprotei archaeon]